MKIHTSLSSNEHRSAKLGCIVSRTSLVTILEHTPFCTDKCRRITWCFVVEIKLISSNTQEFIDFTIFIWKVIDKNYLNT